MSDAETRLKNIGYGARVHKGMVQTFHQSKPDEIITEYTGNTILPETWAELDGFVSHD